jgi:hypothetical protein
MKDLTPIFVFVFVTPIFDPPAKGDWQRVDTGRDITSEGPWCPRMLPRGTSGVLQALRVPEHPGACP